MFTIPIAALVIAIFLMLLFMSFVSSKLFIISLFLAASLIIWGVVADDHRKIGSTEYYNINNVNYTDDMVGQVYIKNGTPIKLYSDVVYDNDVFHVKIDVYENVTWGIKWGYSEAPLKIVKKTIIRTKE